MLATREILIASDRQVFADSMAAALDDEGALVVCIEDREAVHDALQAGFRPDAVLLDGTLPDVTAFAASLRRIPALAATPFVTASPADAEAETVVRRDVRELVAALDGACAASGSGLC